MNPVFGGIEVINLRNYLLAPEELDLLLQPQHRSRDNNACFGIDFHMGKLGRYAPGDFVAYCEGQRIGHCEGGEGETGRRLLMIATQVYGTQRGEITLFRIPDNNNLEASVHNAQSSI
jgi:hypothetical protein